jgi:single-strand DNA-binding protein
MIGRLTADPELRRTSDGTAVCTFTLAVRRPRVKDTSDFIDFVAWRQSAEYLSQYGHKGDIVAVSGSLTSRKWKDKNDNNRINWEIQADTVELLSSKKESQQSSTPNSYAKPQYAQQNFQQVTGTDEKLPWEI